MVAVMTKGLLLVTLLGGLQSAASRRVESARTLAFQHPIQNPLKHPQKPENIYIAEDYVYTSKDYKSGKQNGQMYFAPKSYKSGYVEKSDEGYYSSKSDKSGKVPKSDKSEKSGGKDGKGSKSGKKDKLYHKKNDFEVEYQIKVDHKDDYEVDSTYQSKSSKKGIPDFEFIGIGYKSWKNSKSDKATEYDDGKYSKSMKNSSDGSVKSSKDGKSYGKYDKSSKSGITPSKPTTPPAPAPVGTSHPTMDGSFGVEIPVYSLAYTILSRGEPTKKELDALEDATRSYLDDFFVDEFDQDDFTLYEVFVTDIIKTNVNNKLVIVSYDSEARFDELSTIKPTSTQMGSAVAEAFTGLEMIQYENWLKEMLPSGNIFVGSNIQYYEGDEGIPDKSRNGINATGIAASAVAATLLVAGLALYKSKSNNREPNTEKLNKAPGDMTIAGETFAGETYDGTETVSAVSVDYARRYNDEEDGIANDNLGAIPEDSDSSDEEDNEITGYGRKMIVNALSAFRGSKRSTQRTGSFDDVALQGPTYDEDFNIMPNYSTSEDDSSQMSDSELSQFVATTKQVDDGISVDNNLEIKSILSMDSMDDNSGLSIRDNSSSRRLRTVAEIEALLSSELESDRERSVDLPETEAQQQGKMSRPQTVEEIESLLTADEDDIIVELPFSNEDESIVE